MDPAREELRDLLRELPERILEGLREAEELFPLPGPPLQEIDLPAADAGAGFPEPPGLPEAPPTPLAAGAPEVTPPAAPAAQAPVFTLPDLPAPGASAAGFPAPELPAAPPGPGPDPGRWEDLFSGLEEALRTPRPAGGGPDVPPPPAAPDVPPPPAAPDVFAPAPPAWPDAAVPPAPPPAPEPFASPELPPAPVPPGEVSPFPLPDLPTPDPGVPEVPDGLAPAPPGEGAPPPLPDVLPPAGAAGPALPPPLPGPAASFPAPEMPDLPPGPAADTGRGDDPFRALEDVLRPPQVDHTGPGVLPPPEAPEGFLSVPPAWPESVEPAGPSGTTAPPDFPELSAVAAAPAPTREGSALLERIAEAAERAVELLEGRDGGGASPDLPGDPGPLGVAPTRTFDLMADGESSSPSIDSYELERPARRRHQNFRE